MIYQLMHMKWLHCVLHALFIFVGAIQKVEGQWLDVKGMFLGGVYAGPVYLLIRKKRFSHYRVTGSRSWPNGRGDIAFRQHNGGHTTGPNWPTFINFADRYFKK